MVTSEPIFMPGCAVRVAVVTSVLFVMNEFEVRLWAYWQNLNSTQSTAGWAASKCHVKVGEGGTKWSGHLDELGNAYPLSHTPSDVWEDSAEGSGGNGPSEVETGVQDSSGVVSSEPTETAECASVSLSLLITEGAFVV